MVTEGARPDCIYVTDPGWIDCLRTREWTGEANFWRKDMRQLSLSEGSLFYFKERGTRQIVGRGRFLRMQPLALREAWAQFGVGNGVQSLEEFTRRAEEVLGIPSPENAIINCIVLDSLEWLDRDSAFEVSNTIFAPQTLGAKFIQRGEFPELESQFEAGGLMERVSAAQIYQISQSDLVTAIEDLESGTASHRFKNSERFDVLTEDQRRYPPKAVVGLAARRALGRVLVPTNFSGGESSTAFRLLLGHDFEIATKPRAVGTFDATFSISQKGDAIYLIYESRGPDRNVNYMEGLEALLSGLAELDVVLEDALVDSTTTRRLPVPDRRLRLPAHPYPVHLRSLRDMSDFRRTLTSAAANTARTAESSGGGNPTKRLRLQLSFADDLSLYEVAEILAKGSTEIERGPQPFEFRPSKPMHSTEMGTRRAVEEAVVTHLHYEIQRRLYDLLVAEHGEENVSSEQMTCSGRPADLMVRTPAGYEIYEIKTARSPRDCVRQALGQLLEYGHWPGSPACTALRVVGPSDLDSECENFLSLIRDSYNLPLTYQKI